MKDLILEWAEEVVKSTIMSNVESIDKEVSELKLGISKSGGSLRLFKIAKIVSGKLPIIEYLTLNNEAILTNQFVLDRVVKIDDIKRDSLISLHNILLSNVMLKFNCNLKAEEQIELLGNTFILGYSKLSAIKENKNSRDNDMKLIKDNPLLVPIFVLSLNKDAIFSVVLKVVEEIYNRKE